LVDSTGLKVFGEGEWKTRKWGADKRRTWLKMHIGVDKRSGQIVGVRLTDSGQQDGEEFAPLLASIEGEIDNVNGDGAYDSYANYALIKERGERALIPARHGAVICEKPSYGKDKIDPSARNEVVQEMLALWDEETGDARWKEQSGYHARSRVESEMFGKGTNLWFRYKTVIGDGVRSHDPASQQVEVLLGCKSLCNKLSAVG
jgi:Transposase DDE domain